MRVSTDGGGVVVGAETYRLDVHPTQPVARLTDADGRALWRLFLLAALDTDRGFDATLAVDAPKVTETDGRVRIAVESASTIWGRKHVHLECREDAVIVTVDVTGSGRLGTVRLLGGPYSGMPRWGSGTFHSEWSARTLFSPSPDDPRRLLRSAAEPATIGVIGSAEPGRGHWFFTPAPLLFAGTSAELDDLDHERARWQTMELRCAVGEATFSELRYAPFLGGFSLELAYDGQTVINGAFTTPPLVLRTDAIDPYGALHRHAEQMRAEGVAPAVERRAADWWSRPIFCGWGEQCRWARLEGRHATEGSRRELYDRWLRVLGEHGVMPGTVVIDDKWQTSYGRNDPDGERWPDLRGWIADRHARDQRVLLWFKAWDPEGLPGEACVTDPLGRAIAADPTSPAYAAILRRSLHAMLGTDGLDADGLKVDFTAQTPSGPALRRVGNAWGVALLHRLLELVYRFAKEAKADALVVTHTPSPLFADVTDMIRLNDLMRLADLEPFTPAVAQMRHRARIARSVDASLLIDTDDWCMPNKAEWRAYLEAKPKLGVPALYYVTGMDRTDETFDADDYAAIRDAWARWKAGSVQEA